MDKNFAGLAQKLDSYLKEQTTMRHKKIQAELDFLDGLERRNSALSSTFEDDIEATEDYAKKSKAFTEQMMSLIKARYDVKKIDRKIKFSVKSREIKYKLYPVYSFINQKPILRYIHHRFSYLPAI